MPEDTAQQPVEDSPQTAEAPQGQAPAPPPAEQPAPAAESSPPAEEQPAPAEAPEAREDDGLWPEPEEQVAEAEVDYPVVIEDAGTLRKKVTVTVPAKAIDDKRKEMYGELKNTALVPGFRIGRAPMRLLEKRFGKDVARDVRNAVIGASLGSVLKKNTDLRVIGQPDLDPEKIELPDQGDLSYSFEVEVAPDFTLPELKGIAVMRPVLEVTDERVGEAVERMRQREARLETTGSPAADRDVVNVQMKLRGEGIEEMSRPLALRVAPGQIEGIPLVDLGKELAGKTVGDAVTIAAKVPEAHPTEAWRGKDVTIDLAVTQVRRRVLPDVDDEFARHFGYDSLEELRTGLAARLAAQVRYETSRAMQDQVRQYLLDNTEMDLPDGAVTRHTARVLQRRGLELMRLGYTAEQIEERITKIQVLAGQEARRDLKLSFILQRIAEDSEVEVTDEEINARVAMLASAQNRRPERLRHEMESDGSLEQLAVAIQEEKVLDTLLADAEIIDATAEDEAEAEPESEAESTQTEGAAPETEAPKAQEAEGQGEAPADQDI